MNSMERVLAVLHGEPVDRVPVAGVLCLYGARLTGCGLEDYYTKPEEYVRGQSAIVERFQPDLLLSPLCAANEGKAFGCGLKYFTDYPPNITRRAIRSSDEIGTLVFPDIEADPHLVYTRETVRRLSRQYAGQIPVCALWLDPLDLLAIVVGPDTFMDLVFHHRQAFEEILVRMEEFSVRYGNALLADGAAILIHIASVCGVAMIPRSMAEQIAEPALRRTYAQIKGGILMHGGGYKMAPYLDLYRDLPNLLGFILDSRDNLLRARETVGNNLVLAGNIEGPTLDTKAPEQIRRICARMLSVMAADPRYILSTSAADIPFVTEAGQIDALMQAPAQFRGQ